MLISHGADVNGYVTLDGEKVTNIPLLQYLTRHANDTELIELLIENGADIHMLSLVNPILNKG